MWIPDNGGHWHATRTRGRSGIGGEIALRLQVVPLLSHATAWIEVAATGQPAEAPHRHHNARASLQKRLHRRPPD